MVRAILYSQRRGSRPHLQASEAGGLIVPAKKTYENSKLQSAYERFQRASHRSIANHERWDATRKFLKAISDRRESCSYAEFHREFKTLLKLKSSSRVDEYLAAARFATTLLPHSKRHHRIVDQKPRTPCPNISQMAVANSLLTSSGKDEQLAGQQYLANAVRGKELPAAKTMQRGPDRIQYRISPLKSNIDGLRALAAFLNALAKAGDSSAKQCLDRLSRFVRTGGAIELQIGGVYKVKLAASPALSKELLNSEFAAARSVETSDGRSKPDYGTLAGMIKSGRDARIEQRAQLITRLTGDAAGKIWTSEGNAEELLQAIKTGWEGPEDVRFADVIAENDVDAQTQLLAALQALKTELRGKRVGMIVFPREPQGYIEERLLSDQSSEIADKIMAVDTTALISELNSIYKKLPQKTIEVCVQDALKQLRTQLKCEPSRPEVFREADRRLTTLSPAEYPVNLQTAVDKLLELYPRLALTTTNHRVANAVSRLRDKYGFDPSLESIIYEVDRSLQGRGRVSPHVSRRNPKESHLRSRR